jgi:hypothetical protein
MNFLRQILTLQGDVVGSRTKLTRDFHAEKKSPAAYQGRALGMFGRD